MNDIMIINRAGGGKGKFNSVVLLLSPEVHAQLQRMYVGLAPFKTNSRSTLLDRDLILALFGFVSILILIVNLYQEECSVQILILI